MKIGICENDNGLAKLLFEAVLRSNSDSRVSVISEKATEKDASDIFVIRKSRLSDNMHLLNSNRNVAIRNADLNLNGMNVNCCFIARDGAAFAGFKAPQSAALLKPEDRDKTVEKFIEKMLSSIAMKRKLTGCAYLKEALMLSYSNPVSVHKKLSKELYPTIAAKFGTRGTRVERAIRTAVKDCYDHGNLTYLNTLFDCQIVNPKYPPTNGELISALADEINFALRTESPLLYNTSL